MSNTWSCEVPAGTLSSTNLPSAPVRVPMLVPTMATWAPSTGSPLPADVTRPSMVPVWAAAGAVISTKPTTSASAATIGAALRL